jgi:limonene-1,2-epoxide hydrolase/alkylhydroperoxidase/carboxymuconolactone decarboxylase family protein YurZ/catechol 2,3-dioxygenase-like lactoylglutathione lyase family enzyme
MINNRYDDFFTRVANQTELPLIDNKTKALIAIAVVLANPHGGEYSPQSLADSIKRAYSQGISHPEIQELLLLLCVYIGFNRGADSFVTINKILQQHGSNKMMSATKLEDNVLGDRLTNFSGLGQYLQGVQHFGVTVKDMAKSVEFYTQVLGGQIVVSESELVGDTVQNTLFQKEELDAVAQGIALDRANIPNLRSTKDDALDVKFISFGNVVVELIYFREAGQSNPHQSSVEILPSHIGRVNAMHLSFNVKEGLDLNRFAQMLEAECHRRGMDEVVFNRTVWVNSLAERKALALKHNSFKFWNEGEENTVNWSNDPMEGWSLFYCKGPNGEQLEFNQVTRKVKQQFRQGVQQYNQTNGTAFVFPDFALANADPKLSTQTSDRLDFTFSSPVYAPLDKVWNIVLDKIANPSRYNPEAHNPQILQCYSDGLIRQMDVLGMTVKERIVIDRPTGTITHHLLDNPYFTGKIVNQVTTTEEQNIQHVSYTLSWQPANAVGKEMAEKIHGKLHQAVQMAVLSAKQTAEKLITTEQNMTTLEKLPGQNADLVKRLFSRGEAFDAAGFVTFFTDNPVYQFGNFDVCFDKQSIKQSADNFFSQIDAVYHEIKMMQEVGDVVFVEMDVLYWRKDGSMISLPCCDIFRVEGDKFSELRIFMDVNPVFDSSIPVPASASVLTASAATRLIPPGTMKQHFAQHPEGQQRVKDGFAPKWSITGPQWAIAEQDPSGSPEQLDAVANLAQAVISQDWDTVKSYLTDDVYYKVGSGTPLYGKQAVVDFFIQTFKTTAVFTGHMERKIWQEPDIITLEMDAYYQMVASGKTVTIACCDIYRLRGNKVSEWRVYADMSPWNESANGVVSRHMVNML